MESHRPIIGCTTYRKHILQDNPIDIYGLMPSYIEAVKAAGGVPILIPLGYDLDSLSAIVDRIDGLLIPGGGDVDPSAYNGGHLHPTMYGIDPQRDETEISLLRLAIRESIPFLAICRGIQVLNVALGGTLWADITSEIPGAIVHDNPDSLPRNHLSHTVRANPGSLVGRLMGRSEFWVNSLHHQAIRDLAPELSTTAEAPDGLIEAVEITGHPHALGVQWHPELLIHDDPTMRALFGGLVEAAVRERPVAGPFARAG